MFLSVNYQYGRFIVTGVFTVDHFDLEVKAKEGAWLLPGGGIVPAKHFPITALQVREFCRPH